MNNVKDKIDAALTKIEQDRGVRILFAVESGSRAWGFASPDSDYDVRAVYARPIDWYLQLEDSKADTISVMLSDDLDVVAWDIRKFLCHMKKSNASILEWLGSPMVYRDSELLDRLKGIRDSYVGPAHIAYHYCSMFRHAMEDKDSNGMISIKKLFYAIRANLCVDWVLTYGTMPPTRFADVTASLSLEEEVLSAIAKLLKQKEDSCEKQRVVPDVILADVLQDRQDRIKSKRWTFEPSAVSYDVLTEIFRGIVLQR